MKEDGGAPVCRRRRLGFLIIGPAEGVVVGRLVYGVNEDPKTPLCRAEQVCRQNRTVVGAMI